MEIKDDSHDGIAVLAPVGRIDSNTARDAEAAILPRFADATGVVVDFADLTYISSAGLRVLLMAAKRSKAAGVPLALSGMADPVYEVFKVSGFAKLFDIHPDRESAIRAVGGR